MSKKCFTFKQQKKKKIFLHNMDIIRTLVNINNFLTIATQILDTQHDIQLIIQYTSASFLTHRFIVL